MRILIQVSGDLMSRDTTINENGDVARLDRVTTHINHGSCTREDVVVTGWKVRPDGSVSSTEVRSSLLGDLPDGALTAAERRVAGRTREVAVQALAAALEEARRG